MTKLTKKRKLIESKIDFSNYYNAIDAIVLLQEAANSKFDETLEMAARLGIDPRKGDQMVRGVVSLPKGSGKKVKIAVFAEGEQAEEAKQADHVGMEDLAEGFEKGDLIVDVVISTPAAMKIVGKLGKILGPKGLMPNPKDGTVTNEIAKTVEAAKSGQARFRNDKQGIVHCALGKLSADKNDLLENFETVVKEIKKLKPSSSKGVYLKSLTLSSTMGPGIHINTNQL